MKFPAEALGALALATFVSFAALAQDTATTDLGIEGRKVAETVFVTMDTAGRGAIHSGDLEQFRASVFDGMDTDENGRVTYVEFTGWDPGFAYVAAEAGHGDAYTTASKIVFAFWDRNGDREITDPEMRFAMTADFRRADLDDDGLMTQAEFMQGFPIIVAMRAAIRPDL